MASYYKLTLKSLPEIVFAHAYETASYRRFSVSQNDFLEISHLIHGEITCRREDGITTIPVPSVYVFLYDYNYTASCSSPHRHETVGVRMHYEKQALTREEVLEEWRNSLSDRTGTGAAVLVPELITDTKFIGPISDAIGKMIRTLPLNTHSSAMTAQSILFSLFALLTECAVKMAGSSPGGVSYSDMAYCARATAYIAKNLNRQITVPELAGELNLSVGHLSRIFHAATGSSIIDYINRAKIQQTKQLLQSGITGVSELARQIGMEEKYFCRSFKKYTGQTVTQYRKTQL